MLLAGEGLPVAWCGICKGQVLTHVRLAPDGDLGRSCVACDARVEPLAVTWIGEAADEAGEAVGGAIHDAGCAGGGCGAGTCGRR